MSDISNNIAILSYLKDKIQKWRNIAIILAVIVVLLIIRLIFGNDISSKIETGSYIANIKVEGSIFEDEFRSEILKKIAEDNSAKALIVNIDSPGGGIVGSEILYLELKKIAEKKPVVVLMYSVAASGGYMAALAGEHLVAHNGTLTGSVGVLMQSAEFVDLAQKIGVKFKTYKSAPLKASPSPFERSSEMTNKVVQESIKDSADFFFDLVKERRGDKIKNHYSQIFDGRVFTGRQALKAGLIDEIGSKDNIIKYLETTHKLDLKSNPLRDVKIKKPADKLLERFSSFLPISNSYKQLSGQEIMAIMPF